MSDTPTLERGEEYVVFYAGGPADGQTDRRISPDGAWDEEITVVVAVDGMESLVTYARPEAREVGGQVQVTYHWDEPDSEPIEDPDARGEF